MQDEFRRLADQYTKPLDEVFHGWVVMLNNRLWVSSSGQIFHPTRELAVKRFYNEFHWKVRRMVWNMYGNTQEYRKAWFDFKRINNFEVKYI